MLYIVSKLSDAAGQIELFAGATGNVIPRKGDIVKLPFLHHEVCKKIRADFNNPQFEVKDVEFSYEDDECLNPKVTIYVLSVDFFR